MITLFSRLKARYVHWRLIQGLLKKNLGAVAWAIHQGACLDGWVVKGPTHYEHISIHAPSLGLQFPCEGALELAVEAGCGKDILQLLLQHDARIPDSMAPGAHPDFWERLEWRARQTGRQRAARMREAYAQWLACEHERRALEHHCPVATGLRRAARL